MKSALLLVVSGFVGVSAIPVGPEDILLPASSTQVEASKVSNDVEIHRQFDEHEIEPSSTEDIKLVDPVIPVGGNLRGVGQPQPQEAIAPGNIVSDTEYPSKNPGDQNHGIIASPQFMEQPLPTTEIIDLGDPFVPLPDYLRPIEQPQPQEPSAPKNIVSEKEYPTRNPSDSAEKKIEDHAPESSTKEYEEPLVLAKTTPKMDTRPLPAASTQDDRDDFDDKDDSQDYDRPDRPVSVRFKDLVGQLFNKNRGSPYMVEPPTPRLPVPRDPEIINSDDKQGQALSPQVPHSTEVTGPEASAEIPVHPPRKVVQFSEPTDTTLKGVQPETASDGTIFGTLFDLDEHPPVQPSDSTQQPPKEPIIPSNNVPAPATAETGSQTKDSDTHPVKSQPDSSENRLSNLFGLDEEPSSSILPEQHKEGHVVDIPINQDVHDDGKVSSQVRAENAQDYYLPEPIAPPNMDVVQPVQTIPEISTATIEPKLAASLNNVPNITESDSPTEKKLEAVAPQEIASPVLNPNTSRPNDLPPSTEPQGKAPDYSDYQGTFVDLPDLPLAIQTSSVPQDLLVSELLLEDEEPAGSTALPQETALASEALGASPGLNPNTSTFNDLVPAKPEGKTPDYSGYQGTFVDLPDRPHASSTQSLNMSQQGISQGPSFNLSLPTHNPVPVTLPNATETTRNTTSVSQKPRQTNMSAEPSRLIRTPPVEERPTARGIPKVEPKESVVPKQGPVVEVSKNVTHKLLDSKAPFKIVQGNRDSPSLVSVPSGDSNTTAYARASALAEISISRPFDSISCSKSEASGLAKCYFNHDDGTKSDIRTKAGKPCYAVENMATGAVHVVAESDASAGLFASVVRNEQPCFIVKADAKASASVEGCSYNLIAHAEAFAEAHIATLGPEGFEKITATATAKAFAQVKDECLYCDDSASSATAKASAEVKDKCLYCDDLASSASAKASAEGECLYCEDSTSTKDTVNIQSTPITVNSFAESEASSLQNQILATAKSASQVGVQTSSKPKETLVAQKPSSLLGSHPSSEGIKSTGFSTESKFPEKPSFSQGPQHKALKSTGSQAGLKSTPQVSHKESAQQPLAPTSGKPPMPSFAAGSVKNEIPYLIGFLAFLLF